MINKHEPNIIITSLKKLKRELKQRTNFRK